MQKLFLDCATRPQSTTDIQRHFHANDQDRRLRHQPRGRVNDSWKVLHGWWAREADPRKSEILSKHNTVNHSFSVFQIVIIQKYYRRWLAKRYVDKVRTDKAERHEWEKQEELRKKKEKEDRIRREFERRMNPKTKEDFDLLYHALESKF